MILVFPFITDGSTNKVYKISYVRLYPIRWDKHLKLVLFFNAIICYFIINRF